MADKYVLGCWKRAMGVIYLRLDGGKRKVTYFLKDFLEKFDKELFKIYTGKKGKGIYDREKDMPLFIEGKEISMVVINNHITIHPVEEREMETINMLREMVKLPGF